MINPSENLRGRREENTSLFLLSNIKPMENHPFQVRDDEEMEALVESIRQFGVLNPIIVRIKQGYREKYEIVSGHRRYEACKRLNKYDIPVIVRDMTDDEAILAMVDSNLQRERILPSERAMAYKMKFDAMKRQGARTDLTSEQVAPKLSAEIIAEQNNTSKDTVKRYIRLNKLVKPLLDLVDTGRIGLTPAEKLSYLTEDEQMSSVDLMKDLEITPSLSQATKMKEKSAKQKLDADTMFEIMENPKPNQKETLKLDLYKLREIFPNYLPKDMEKAIYQILLDWQRREQAKAQNRSTWDRDGR